MFKGRTRAVERRSKNTAQTSLISEEDELNIALHVEEENTLEQALQVDIEASIEMPTGKMQDLPPPRTTQAEGIDHHLVRRLSTLRRLSSMHCLP